MPAAGFFLSNEILVVEYAGGSPHIRYGIVGSDTSRLAGFIQFFLNVGRDIGKIVRGLPEIAVNGKEQILLQHTLNDIFRRAYNIEIFVSAFNLGEHDFINVKYLVDDTDIFSRLLLIPGGELGEDIFVDVVCPVVYLQYMAAFFTGMFAGGEHCDAAQ